MNGSERVFYSQYLPMDIRTTPNIKPKNNFNQVFNNMLKDKAFEDTKRQKLDNNDKRMLTNESDSRLERGEKNKELKSERDDYSTKRKIQNQHDKNNRVEGNKLEHQQSELFAQAQGISIELLQRFLNGETLKEFKNIEDSSELKELIQMFKTELQNLEGLIDALSQTDVSQTEAKAFVDRLGEALDGLGSDIIQEDGKGEISLAKLINTLEKQMGKLKGEIEGLNSTNGKIELIINGIFEKLNAFKAQQDQLSQQQNISVDRDSKGVVVNELGNSTSHDDKQEKEGNNAEDSGFQFKGKVEIVDLQKAQKTSTTEGVVFQDALNIEDTAKNINQTQNQFNIQGKSTENVLKQVVENTKITLTDDRSEMVMQLKPENLGKLSLKIVTERGIMVAQFTAESQQVKEIIEANLNQLRDALESQGIDIKGFSVSVDDKSEQKDAFERQNKPRIKRITQKEQAPILIGEYNRDISRVHPYQWSDSSIDFIA